MLYDLILFFRATLKRPNHRNCSRNAIVVSSFLTAILLLSGCDFVNDPKDAPRSTEEGNKPFLPNVVTTAFDSRVLVQWSEINGANSYTLYWSNQTNINKNSATAIPVQGASYTHANLANGNNYYYALSVTTGQGESALSPSVLAIPVAAELDAPVGTSIVVGDGRNTLYWDSVAGAHSYSIYWNTDAGGNVSKQDQRIDNVISPFVHSNLTNDTKYNYIIVANREDKAGKPSTVLSGTPSQAMPTAPVNITADYNAGQLIINWDEIGNATTYTLYWDTAAGVTTSDQRIENIIAPFNFTPIQADSSYFFILVASHANGSSAASAEFSVDPAAGVVSIPTSGPIPSTPILKPFAIGNQQVSLDWENTDSNTKGYNIYWKTSSGVTKQDNKIANILPPYTHIDLINNVTIHYIVTAINDNGESIPSTEVSATPQLVKPGVPANVTSLAGDTWVGLSWLRVNEAQGYNIYWRAADQAGNTFPNSMTDVIPPIMVSDLTNGKEYVFAVTAVNVGGESDYSETVNVIPQIPAPAAPTGVVAIPGNTQVKLQWDQAGATSNNITAYTIYWSARPGVLPKTGRSTDVGNANDYLHENISNGRTIYYVVTAKNAGGESLPSQEIQATPQNIVPEAPQDVFAEAGNELVTVGWTDVADRNYNLYYWSDAEEGANKSVVTNVKPNYPLPLPGKNGQTYHFNVSALNAANESVLSPEVTATPNVPPPTQRPTALSATAATTQVTLNWAGVNNASAYRIYWSATSSIDPLSSTFIDGAQPGFIHQGLNNGTTYYYAVAATNAASIGPISNIISAIPQRSSPPNPNNLRAIASDGEVILSWDTVSNADSYNVYWSLSTTTPISEWIKISGFQPGAAHLQLLNGATYQYRVSAVNAGGESPILDQISVSAKPQVNVPAAPAALASSAGDGVVVLNWQQQNGQSYNLYWSNSPGVVPGATGVNKLAAVNTFYSHAAPSNGNAYYYVVTAQNAGGESAASEETFAIPSTANAGVPGSLRAEAGDQLNTLHWQNISDSSASYNLYWTVDPVVAADIGNQLANATQIPNVTSPYQHTALSNGQRYYYVLTANTASGESAASNYATAVPQINPIGPPTGISLSANDASVTINWKADTDSSLIYHIYWANDPTVSPSTGLKLANSSAPFVHGSLTNGIALFYVLTAENSAGESAPSAVYSATPGVTGNTAPIIASGASINIAMDEDGSPVPFSLNLSASDVDGDILSWSISTNPSSGAVASVNGAGNSVAVDFTPLANFNGSDSFVVSVSDGSGGLDTIAINVNIRPVNDVPTLAKVIPAQTTLEDAAFDFQIAVDTFVDLDGDVLTYSATTGNDSVLPTWLSFDSVTRSFSGIPLNADVGVLSVKVSADDGNAFATDTFNLTVVNTNDVPSVAVAIPDQGVVQNALLDYQFPIATFIDEDNDVLSYTATLSNSNPLPAWLSFTASTRTFSGTPSNADVGAIEIAVIADDGNGGTIADTFFINVGNSNDVPTVANPIPDQVATEDSVFDFPFALNSFNDLDNDTLSYTARQLGTTVLPVWLSFDGPTRTFSGTPLNEHVGQLTIIVTADDGNGGSVTDNFDITVANSNDAPVAVNDPYNVNENSISVALTVLANDTDVDVGANLLVDAVGATNNGGTAAVSADKLTINYQPAAGFVGTETFTYTITDGIAISNAATVTINISNINDAPMANADSFSVDEDSSGNILNVLANDTDPDVGSVLKIVASSLSVPSNGGTVLLNATNDAVLYSPSANFVGSETFSYLVSDGSLNSVSAATVSLSVNNINDAPTITGQNSLSTAEETGLTITLSDLLVTDIDNPGYPAGFSLSVQAGTDYTVVGNTITPVANFNGDLSVPVTVNDGLASSLGFNALVTVTPLNDVPTIAAALTDVSTAEDSVFGLSAAAVFTDADGDVLSLSATQNGGAPLPSWLSFDAIGESFSGTPQNADVGSLTVALNADDGKGGIATDIFVITVTNTNDVPVAVNDPFNVNENSNIVALSVLANDTDVDVAANLSVNSVGPTSNGGTATPTIGNLSIDYQPAAGFVGTETFTYTITDGIAFSNTATVTITINNLNDAPNAVADSYAVDEDSIDTALLVLSNDTDLDAGTVLTIVATSLSTPSNGGAVRVNATNDAILYSPATDFAGTETFTYLITDGLLNSATAATVTMTVNNINDAPTITGQNPLSTPEETALTMALTDLLVTDIDNPGYPIGFTLSVQPGNNYTVLGDTITPIADFNGDLTVPVTVSDGLASSLTFNATVTVTPLNDVPSMPGALVAEFIAEDSLLGLSVAAVFNDADGDTLALTAAQTSGALLPQWLTFNALGKSFNGTPLNADVGQLSIDLKADDGNGGVAINRFTLTVTNTNDVPVAANDPFNVDENSNVVPLNVLANDSDVDVNDAAKLLVNSVGPTNNGGTATPSTGNLTIDYQPAAGFVGTETFTYTITDGTAISNTATVTVTIKNVNDAPTANADTFPVEEDTSSNILDVLGNDTDPDLGTVLKIAIGSLSLPDSGGTVILNATNDAVLYTPATDFVGVETFTYFATDLSLNSALAATVTVSVTNINDAPTITGQNLISTPEETGLTMALSDLLVTDIDNPGYPVGFTLAVQAGTNYTVLGNTITPATDFNGDLIVPVTVSDGLDSSLPFKAIVSVTPVNDVPTMPGAISTVSIAEDSLLGLSVAAVFNDADGDPLTLTAAQSSGALLPGWLVFSAAGPSFDGTPLNADVGSITIDLKADDLKGGVAVNRFTLTVTNTNDAPVVTAAIGPQSATEDAVFTLQFPVNTFSDPDVGDVLSYSALSTPVAPAPAEPLPLWLSFNPATRTFTGTPLNADVKVYSIDVFADDGKTGIVKDTFQLTVVNTNDKPIVNAAIPPQSVNEGSILDFSFAVDTFIDPDKDSMTYSANIAGGVLPTWLTFTPATRNFGGTPSNADVGALTITVVADDLKGGVTTTDLALTVVDINNPPTFRETSPATIVMSEDNSPTPFALTLNAEDLDGELVGWTISSKPLNGGVTLTDPLIKGTFPSNTRIVDYTPTLADFNGTDTFTVTIVDAALATASFIVNVTITPENDAPYFTSANKPLDAVIGQPYRYDVSFDDVDTLLSLVNITATSPTWMSVTRTSDTTATLGGTPLTTDFGSASFTPRVTDDQAAFSEIGPFTINVVDAPTDAMASTSVGGTKATAGVETTLPIQARDANGNNQHTGGDIFTAVVVDGANVGKPIVITDNSNGTYTLKYTPTIGGNDYINIKLGTSNIGPSTGGGIYSVSVSAGATDPAQTVVTVPADGKLGTVSNITAIPKDAFGNFTGGSSVIKYSITGANPTTSAVTMIYNSGVGSYDGTYIPAQIGYDQITVTVNGVVVPGSPFTSRVVPPDELVDFAPIQDLALSSCIRNEAKFQGATYAHQLLTLTCDSAVYGEIKNIFGLEYFYNLTTLELITTSRSGGHSVTNLDPLLILNKLQTFALTKAYLAPGLVDANIVVLENLTALTKLVLHDHEITDISPLKPLVSMQYLALGRNNIASIDALAYMSSLDVLDLNDPKTAAARLTDADFWVMDSLVKLTRLGVRGHALVDASVFQRLTLMTSLDISGNNVNNIGGPGGLSNMQNLVDLYISNNSISDISVIGLMPNVWSKTTIVDLDNNLITNLKVLATKTNLTTVYANNNRINDISGLIPLSLLTTLYLRDNNISDLTPFKTATFTGLTSLYLENNKIFDLTPFARPSLTTVVFPANLKILQLSNVGACTSKTCNNIIDLFPLRFMTSLTRLDIDNVAVKDISPLVRLTNMATLHASNNLIATADTLVFSGLSTDFTKLSYLDLTGNSILDVTNFVGFNGKALKTLFLSGNITSATKPGGNVDNLVKLVSGSGTTSFYPTIYLHDNPFMSCTQFATLKLANRYAYSNNCP